MAKPTPWWETVRLRDEIVSAEGAIQDVQMSLYNAVYGAVGGKKVPYEDARYYGDITFPSSSLVGLMAQIAARLGSSDEAEDAGGVWRLDQGMGGGKSHGLIGLWHLVTSPGPLRQTDLGRRVFAEAEHITGRGGLAEDLNRPICIVLSCDNMTAGKGDKDLDGTAETLGERFLWRLFDRADQPKLYREFREHTGNKERLAEALDRVGRPVLILVDEILDYVRTASAQEDDRLVVQDMAFLRALLDSVNKVPNCVLVMVMIASEKDSIVLTDLGRRCRDELDSLLVRNGRTESVTSANDSAEIIRRRLFDNPPPAEVVARTADSFASTMGGKWGKDVFDRLTWATKVGWAERVARAYPFHPSLIDLAEQEWSLHTGFQRVRSTIQIFAAAIWAQQQRSKAGAWAPALLGPGDLPLSAREVRGALLNSGLIEDQRTVSSYREIASTEVVAEDDERGTARTLDLKREGALFTKANPRAAERAGTALFVYSISPRAQGRRGATEHELKAASFVPDVSYGPGDAEVVLGELKSSENGLAALEEITGKGGQPARLLLSTRQTLNMFIRAQLSHVSDTERDQELAAQAFALANTGPFKKIVPVEATGDEQADPRKLRDILAAARIDDAHTNRLVILDPRRFSRLNGVDKETQEAIQAALGIGPDKLVVGWASSAVFALVNTQRRAHARKLAVEVIARKRVLEIEAVRSDEELLEKAKAELRDAEKKFTAAVRDTYQHVIYLGEDVDGNRVAMHIRFGKDGQSSLDGSVVWAALTDADKAFGKDEFDAKALVHNLRDSDYGRPLSEIRDSFWNAPRLPLLPGGEEDLRRAVFGAIRDGKVVIVDKDGNERAAASPSEVNVGQAGLRLARPGAALAQEVTVPAVAGLDRESAEHAVSAAGFVLAASGSGAVVTQEPAAGTMAPTGSTVMVALSTKGAGSAPKSPEQVTVTATINTSLSSDEQRNALRLLLATLGNTVEESGTHIQLTVKITVPVEAKDEVVQRAENAGAYVSTVDL